VKFRWQVRPRVLTSTLFPYTTLFRSPRGRAASRRDGRRARRDGGGRHPAGGERDDRRPFAGRDRREPPRGRPLLQLLQRRAGHVDRKSTRLNSSHVKISYAVFCLKKK